jgi:hypothetical protein
VGSFAITFIYLPVASGELALAVEISERRVGLQRARLLRRRQRRKLRRAGSRRH